MKTCRRCWKKFEISAEERRLLKKFKFKIWDFKTDIGEPELCPDCRSRNLFMFRNERFFYKNFCSICGKPVVSIFSPYLNFKVVCKECEKKVNNDDYFLDYKKWKFFNQIRELLSKVYLPANFWWNVSWWVFYNHVTNSENIFFSYSVTKSNNVFNSWRVINSKNVKDSILVYDSENVLDSIGIVDSKNVVCSFDVTGSKEVYFSVWVKNKEYVFFNEDFSNRKDEFEKLKRKLKSYNFYLKYKKKFDKLLTTYKIKNVDKFVTKDVVNSMFVYFMTNCQFMYNVFYDDFSKKVYNTISSDTNVNVICSFGVYFSKYTFYCIFSQWLKYSLWSIWLENKKFTILNKEYNLEDWTKVVLEIIDELKTKKMWWKFFYPFISPYPYNDSIAQDFYPIKKLVEVKKINSFSLLEKIFDIWFLDWKEGKQMREFLKKNKAGEKIIDKNWSWIVYILEPEKVISKAILDLWGEEIVAIWWRTKKYDFSNFFYRNFIDIKSLPDNIDDYTDDIILNILNNFIKVEGGCKFFMTPQEINFHKKFKIAIFKNCPFERLEQKIKILLQKGGLFWYQKDNFED